MVVESVDAPAPEGGCRCCCGRPVERELFSPVAVLCRVLFSHDVHSAMARAGSRRGWAKSDN
eukprot:6765080-Prymnesium_polylepis.1